MELKDYISPDNSFNCTIKLFDRKVDLCRFGESLSTNPFMAIAINAIEKSLSIKFTCPIDPQPFHLKYVPMQLFHKPI